MGECRRGALTQPGNGKRRGEGEVRLTDLVGHCVRKGVCGGSLCKKGGSWGGS